MKISKIVVGSLKENCYILSIEDKILVVDPGDEYSKIKEKIEGKKLLGVLITHHHFDHVGALSELLEEYPVPLYDAKTKDKEVLIHPFHFKIISTQGHTNDSVTFYFEDDKIMFTGDFLFKQSIGRTDLGGNDDDMRKSIQKIKEYPDVLIYPGHGDETTLNFEKKFNPFLFP